MRFARGVAVAVLLSAALLISYVVLWATAITPTLARGSDFSASYVAATLLRDGHGTGLYDESLEHAKHATLLPATTRFDLPFLTPPTTALLTVPLTLLDATAAFRLFGVIQLALTIAAALIAARAAPWGESCRPGMRLAAALLGSATAGVAILLLLGQWDGVTALGIACAYANWRRQRGGRAAAWLTATSMLAKPHLAIGLGLFLLARRIPREIGAAVLSGVVVGILWLLVAGFSGTGAFVAGLFSSLNAHGDTLASSTFGINGLLASWFGNSSGPQTAGLILSVIPLIGCIWLGHRSRGAGMLDVTLAGAVVLSLLASPHLLGHDITVLAPVCAWMVGWATGQDWRPERRRPWPTRRTQAVIAVWVLINVATGMDAGASGVGAPGRLVPWTLIAGGAVALYTTVVISRNERSSSPTARSR